MKIENHRKIVEKSQNHDHCFLISSQTSKKHKLFLAIRKDNKESFKVDLENQKIQIISSGKSENFAIDAYKKTCLINGFDDIDFLVSKLDAIKKFEEKQTQMREAAIQE